MRAGQTIRIKQTERRPIVVALLAFVLTTVAAVTINSWLRQAFTPSYSISRYVGSETWSAIVFALANVVVAVNVLSYLYLVGERWRLARVYFWLVVAMMVGLIGLSACPVGYFDTAGYATSVPSHVHEVSSRMMFCCMLAVAGMIVLCQRASRATRMAAAVYVAYGVVCILGYLTKAQWFLQHLLLFESCYLFGFLAFCLGLQGRSGEILSATARKK